MVSILKFLELFSFWIIVHRHKKKNKRQDVTSFIDYVSFMRYTHINAMITL